MVRVLVLYGTTDGHTAKIAGALATTLHQAGCSAEVVAADGSVRFVRAADYDAVVVCASLHAGGYQKSVRRWLHGNREGLVGRPTAFLGVCLGILEHKADVDQHIEDLTWRFLGAAGWRPDHVRMVAGALPYTRYSWLKKRMMRRIASKAGGGTDIRRDYEYTDWQELREFARSFARLHGLVAEQPAEELAAV